MKTLLTSEKSILAQELTLVHHERQHQDTGQDHRLQHSHIEEFRIYGQVPVTSSKLGAAHAWNGFFTRVLDQSRAERVDVNNFPIKRPRRGGPTPHCLRNTGMLTPGTTHSHAPDQQPTTNPNQPNDGQSINGQRANPNCVPATTLFALSLTTRRPLFGGW